MKKLISSILILIIFTTSFTFSFANKSSDKVLLKENGKGKNYQIVNLKIDGETVKSKDVPPIIYILGGEGRTLVPLRMIIEHLEDKLAAKIEWDDDKREVKIVTKEKEIILKIDSPDAIVNGVKKRLPDSIPAKLLVLGDCGRTMVPIRFFADEFGIDIDWDAVSVTASLKTPEKPEEKPDFGPSIPQEDIDIADVTDIRVEMNGSVPQIRIKISERVNYKELKLKNPERLVIDLNNTKFNLKNKNKLETNGTSNIKTDGKSIKKIRASQFQIPTEEKPDDLFITRIVVELGDLPDYEISFDDRTGELVIDFTNYIYNVKKENINIKEVVVIEGDIVDD
ncbi:MAG TPA: stalk domain-containing protein, partial [Oscillospiraceae bacterium]|nr:stalk domain-containing protein [Oscillospiraceae bacterium]